MISSRSALSTPRLRRCLGGVGLVGLLVAGSGGVAVAQSASSRSAASRPIVQSAPAAGSHSPNLNNALARLGRNPQDVDALIDAGNAALATGDVDASIGFFSKARRVSPTNPRAMAGLAGAYVRSGNPFDALPLFNEAERANALNATAIGDRGLAYDLLGDTGTAQRYYRQALSAGPDDELTRRLALSLAISGDRRGSEDTLVPLLQRQDKAAWRTRALSLAILGQQKLAEEAAFATLPRNLAEAITPYLRYMPQLTPAQQAAAANFGQFPRASEIGRDDPRVARYAAEHPTRVAAGPGARLTPSGQPLGRGSRSKKKAEAPNPAAVHPSRVEVQTVAAVTPSPVSVVSTPAAKPVASSKPAAPAPTVGVAIPLPAPEVKPHPVAAKPNPAISGLPAAGNALSTAVATQASSAAVAPASPPQPVVPVAKPVAAPVTPANPQPSFSSIFSEFSKPGEAYVPQSGAVDIRRVAPVRPAPVAAPAPKSAAKPATKPGTKPATKPAPPPNPSRVWVQLSTGRDKDALSLDWRRLTRQSASLFKGKKPFTSEWGRNTRLLTGPFENEAAARAFLNDLNRAGIDSFIWTSPNGQVVDTLARN